MCVEFNCKSIQRANFPPSGHSVCNVRLGKAADKPLLITSRHVVAFIKKIFIPSPKQPCLCHPTLKQGRQVPLFLNTQVITICALLTALYEHQASFFSFPSNFQFYIILHFDGLHNDRSLCTCPYFLQLYSNWEFLPENSICNYNSSHQRHCLVPFPDVIVSVALLIFQLAYLDFILLST